MSVFIKGTGVISTQQTFDKHVLKNGFVSFEGNRWPAHEPDYSHFIDGKQIRRMSRIIRMGIVASLLATREAEIEKPDAIIVGTAFGCLEDTYSFLSKLVQYKEDMLSPTAFIHSTHNTIAAQIALLFQCRGYNSTYVHRALSFESALTDAMLLLDEGSVNNVLVGGIDEITNDSFAIKNRLGFYREPVEIQSNNLYNHAGKGSAAGEGSTFFSLTALKDENCYARIVATDTFSFMNVAEAAARTTAMLTANEITQPDLLLTGHNGDLSNDKANDAFATEINCTDKVLKYKHWCGEYATAPAFATWLGAEILKVKDTPDYLNGFIKKDGTTKNILIYNQQEDQHHSITLLQSC